MFTCSGISLSGGLFVWMMVFVTHLHFRKYWQVGGDRALPIRVKLFPFSTILGGLAVLAILLSTWWVDGMRVALQTGIPWLLMLTLVYFTWGRQRERVAQRRIAAGEGASPSALD